MREGGESKHEVASSVEGQPQGGRRKPEWHADLVPGPLDLRGEVLLGDGKFSTSLTEVGKQHNDLWIW